MPWLAINGINVGGIALRSEQPTGPRRDIGDVGPANDGTLRSTRQTRKLDLKFKTKALSAGDAHAWESLFIGEGEVWSFNSPTPGFYGSKGSGPTSVAGLSISTAATPKFGNGKLVIANLNSFTVNAAVTNIFGRTTEWTAMVWRSTDGSTWSHYIVRSDGAKWVDGVRNDGASTSWLSGGGGAGGDNIGLTNGEGANRYYDDLVVLPFKILDAWAPVFGVATTAFSALPFLNATGNMVIEQGTRSVLGQVDSEDVVVANVGSGRSNTVKQLEVDLKAV